MVVVSGDADCTGDASRGMTELLLKSCVHTSSTGFLPRKPVLLIGVEVGVPGIGEAPRLGIGDPAAKVRVNGNEILGFAFMFSVLPPNLKKPTLRCDEVEVEVGREVGMETSLEWDDVVVLCVSSTSSAGASGSGSRLVMMGGVGLGVDERVGEVFGLTFKLGLGMGLEYKLGGGGEREDTSGVNVGADTGGVALVVANLAAIGGKGTLDADADSGPKAEDIVDPDVGKGMLGIGGTSAIGLAFRLKNDGDFLGLAEPDDFDDALVFWEEAEEMETASERYPPSLAGSVS